MTRGRGWDRERRRWVTSGEERERVLLSEIEVDGRKGVLLQGEIERRAAIIGEEAQVRSWGICVERPVLKALTLTIEGRRREATHLSRIAVLESRLTAGPSPSLLITEEEAGRGVLLQAEARARAGHAAASSPLARWSSAVRASRTPGGGSIRTPGGEEGAAARQGRGGTSAASARFHQSGAERRGGQWTGDDTRGGHWARDGTTEQWVGEGGGGRQWMRDGATTGQWPGDRTAGQWMGGATVHWGGAEQRESTRQRQGSPSPASTVPWSDATATPARDRWQHDKWQHHLQGGDLPLPPSDVRTGGVGPHAGSEPGLAGGGLSVVAREVLPGEFVPRAASPGEAKARVSPVRPPSASPRHLSPLAPRQAPTRDFSPPEPDYIASESDLSPGGGLHETRARLSPKAPPGRILTVPKQWFPE
eukprot:Hpha_TRINITY_DN17314_c0_g1::TRINITY_DN17314_c0_g1_i1::g.137927::m.137927